MPARKRGEEAPRSRSKPATTPEDRENELVAYAHDLAEKQILAGTASSQVITHFLKLGSTRERLEQERLAHENELTKAKIEAMAGQARIEELYTAAINAMRRYSGEDPANEDDVED